MRIIKADPSVPEPQNTNTSPTACPAGERVYHLHAGFLSGSRAAWAFVFLAPCDEPSEGAVPLASVSLPRTSVEKRLLERMDHADRHAADHQVGAVGSCRER